MIKKYRVKLIQQGNLQSLPIPTELNFSTPFVTIRQENEKLIIEPLAKKSLIEVLSNLEPLEEDFPDVDQGLLPLDDNKNINARETLADGIPRETLGTRKIGDRGYEVNK